MIVFFATTLSQVGYLVLFQGLSDQFTEYQQEGIKASNSNRTDIHFCSERILKKCIDCPTVTFTNRGFKKPFHAGAPVRIKFNMRSL